MTVELFRNTPNVEDVGAFLDSMTYLDYLTNVVGVSPEYAEYVNKPMACMGCGLGADVVSAYTAKGFFQPGTAGFDIKNGIPDVGDTIGLTSFPEGNCGIARHFVKAMIPDVFPQAKTLNDVLTHKVNWRALDKQGQAVRIRLNSTVADVRHNGSPDASDSVSITYLRDGKLHTVKAKRVIMACEQQELCSFLVYELSSEVVHPVLCLCVL